jgi:hypothetical protein
MKEAKAAKVTKTEPDGPTPSPGQLTTIQIKEMMANAQRMIEERKRALGAMGGAGIPPPGMTVPPVQVLPTMPTLATEPPRVTAAVFDGKRWF